MIDARHYEVHDTLRNGTAVTIRAIRPDDRDRLGAAFGQLEPESIYTRFFYRKRELTDAELTAATDIDFERVVSLVVTTGSGRDEIVIGGGRYVRLDLPDSAAGAEVAFTIEEDYQRLGLASRLLRHLAQIARAKGISRFEAEVLPGNTAMLGVFARSGLPMQHRTEDGVVHVVLSLESGAA